MIFSIYTVQYFHILRNLVQNSGGPFPGTQEDEAETEVRPEDDGPDLGGRLQGEDGYFCESQTGNSSSTADVGTKKAIEAKRTTVRQYYGGHWRARNTSKKWERRQNLCGPNGQHRLPLPLHPPEQRLRGRRGHTRRTRLLSHEAEKECQVRGFPPNDRYICCTILVCKTVFLCSTDIRLRQIIDYVTFYLSYF